MVLTLPVLANRVPDQHADESDESEAEEQSNQDTATTIVEKICHARKKSTLTASKRQKEGEGKLKLFDPSLDREDKDEYKFDPPKVITKFLEQHFRKGWP